MKALQREGDLTRLTKHEWEFIDERAKIIEKALQGGKAVLFTYPNGIKKLVTEMKQDACGDLIASKFQGFSPYIFWEKEELIMEVVNKEYKL